MRSVGLLAVVAGCAFELTPAVAPGDAPDASDAPVATDAPSDAAPDAGLDAGPDAPPSEATFVIAGSADDAMEDPGGPMLVAYSWASLYSANHWGGLQFVLTGVAPGATIHEAILELTIDSGTEDNPNLVIGAQASPTPAPFTTALSNISSRTLGVERVSWVATNIGSGLRRSPSVKTLVQERVSAAGWTAGARLVFIVDGQTGSNFEWRQYDFAPAGMYAARLQLQFTNP